MVSSPEPLATDVGLQIMKQGGNAFDAAVAMGFALAVTFPEAGNIGGGGFFVGLTEHGTALALDFREAAPSAASKNMYLDDQGNIVPGRSLSTYLAVGVPGTVDGLVELQKKFGKLTLADDMRPAIKLARDGFTISAALHTALTRAADMLTANGPAAAVFYPGGSAPAEGSTLVESDLASTLQRVSNRGRDGFYKGEIARMIAANMEREGGLITEADLAKYHAKWKQAFVFRVGDYKLITHPLPSSGGVTIDQILHLADLSSLKKAGHNSAEYAQILTEAERLAYADRNYFLGDQAYVNVPVDELVSDSYLSARRKLMPVGKAGTSSGVQHGTPEKNETTHFCVVDPAGNVAAITYTLNGGFGLGAVVPGAGFLLNNEMDDFTSKPGSPNMFGLVQGEANAIQPGKRPLSSMTPTIVEKDGRFFATIGSPGGSTIITTVLQVFLNLALFDMPLNEAVDSGRFHHQWLPDVVEYEPGAFSPEVLEVLKGMGYKLQEVGGIGDVHAIQRLSDGTLAGWSDKRGSGKAAGY